MKRITKIRGERGLSRSRLSVLSGVNVTSIYEFERGNRKPYPKALRKLADALCYEGDPAELFEEVDQ